VCEEIEIKERETERGEGEEGEMFIRVSKTKFKEYRLSILLTSIIKSM
jgi:hypothetical protein